MIGHDLKVNIIDFPQMVSTSHLNAEDYFDRDVNGVYSWFTKKYGVDPKEIPVLQNVIIFILNLSHLHLQQSLINDDLNVTVFDLNYRSYHSNRYRNQMIAKHIFVVNMQQDEDHINV